MSQNLQLNSFLYVAIVIGGALLVLGFFGCCGSCCESICAISIYFILVLILFVVEVVAIVLYFVNKTNVMWRLPDALINSMFQLQQGFQTIWRDELVSKYNTQQQIHQVLDQIQSSVSYNIFRFSQDQLQSKYAILASMLWSFWMQWLHTLRSIPNLLPMCNYPTSNL